MDRLRILVALTTPVLESIVLAALRLERNVEIVRGTIDRDLAEGAIDVVVTDVGVRSAAQLARELLARWPGMRVLTLSDDGRTARLFEFRPHVVELGEASPEGLRAAIRHLLQAEVE